MIKILILLLGSFLCFYTHAQHNFTYSVELQDRKASTYSLLLVEYEVGGIKYTDSLQFNGSVNVITRSLAQPVSASMYQPGDKAVTQVFLANNHIRLSITDGTIGTIPYALEDEFLYLSANDRIRPGYFPLYGELNARNDTVGLQKLSVIFDSLRSNDITKAKEYFESKPTSLLSLYAFDRFAAFNGDYSALTQDFDKLPAWAKESPDGKSIRAKIEGAIAAQKGAKAKLFAQSSAQGDLIKLSAYSGKYVLLDFWASWCGPCRKEHPDLLKAYGLFKDKNFEIISISLDNNKEAWLKAITKDGLTWPNVSDLKGMQNEVAILYGVQSIPANFLISPDGKIISKNLSGKELSEVLKELLEIH